MGLKYFKIFFIYTIIFLVLAGIYIIYIREKENAQNEASKTSLDVAT